MSSKFYFLILWYALHLNSGEEIFHSVSVADRIILSGCHGFGISNQWNLNDKILYFGPYLMQGQYGDSIMLSGNYSLLIVSVNISHEGVYECRRNLTTAVTHHVAVEGL